MQPSTIDAQRGRIYDRNHQILALSVGAYALYALPSERRDVAEAARQLAPYLSLSESEIIRLLTDGQRGVWLDRRISAENADRIRALGIPDIRLIERPQRFYPQKTLAAQVIGIAGVDNQGLEGLEYYYDRLLSGEPGKLVAEKDATQQPIPGGAERFIAPRDGYDLILSIDEAIQYNAERELAAAVQETGSSQGVILIMNPRTGEILANSVYPFFDANDFAAYPLATRRNIAVTDQFEPGSTFKVITGSVAWDLGLVDENSVFEVRKEWSVGGGTVRNWHIQGEGKQTFIQALENSDNIVFAQISSKIGPERFYEYLRDFGFGQKLGVDFPGEATGKVAQPGTIQHGAKLQWANIGFGQGIAVTPLQLLSAVSAIANSGKLMRPHYVLEIRDIHGRLVEKTEPEVLAQPISPSTARKFVEMMRSVVVNGTGSRADIAGFQVAGKTGTAEVPEGGGYGDQRIASFVGFAPADDPQVAALVMLFNPQTEVKYGGVLAAPVFQKVVRHALEHLDIPRKDKPLHSNSQLVTVPNVRNYPLIEAQILLAEAGLQSDYYGDGAYVIDQVPSPGSRVPLQTKITLFFYGEEQDRWVTVPDVRGLSMRDASAILIDRGLRIRVRGTGLATEQHPAAGTKAAVGSVIEVEFSP